jgi:hypothetical protein
MESQLVFLKHVGGRFFKASAAFEGESQAEAFLAKFRTDFQRKHRELPQPGVDYKLEWRAPEPGQYEATALGVENQSYAILSEMRQVMSVAPGTEHQELPPRISNLLEAVRRAHGRAEGAMDSGNELGSAMAEIEGILRQALVQVQVGGPQGRGGRS